MAVKLTEGMVRLVLSAETSPQRFERFCVDLYTQVDRRKYVPTSFNYDQGRDARSTDAGHDAVPRMICASLRKDALDKATEDSASIFKHAKPEFVRVCSNQPLTERVADMVAEVFRTAAPHALTVIVDGLTQLVTLACEYPDLVEKTYPGEVANLRSALAVNEVDVQSVQLTGMRIALTTQLSNDASRLRDEVQRNLVLTALSQCGSCTVNRLTAAIGQLLHLPRSFPSDYLTGTLADLEGQAMVQKGSSNEYILTEHGRIDVAKRTEEGSSRLSKGQEVVRAALSDLCGDSMSDEQFAHTWRVFQDAVANMFLMNGIYIINSVASIIDGKTKVTDHPDLEEEIDALSRRVAALSVWGARSKEVAQAVSDMFKDATSDAFDWLSDLCVVYVSMCSLGLDRHAQDQITQRLRELDLLLDTDVLLSFLSAGEPAHIAIKGVVNGWKRITGSVYAAPYVLEEAAYHAWIANRDYEEVWRQLDTMDDQDAHRIIVNAFVRGFRKESRGKTYPKMWSLYIGQYRGKFDYDYSKLLPILKEDGVVPLKPERVDLGFAKNVADWLWRRKGKEDQLGSAYDRDKCDRDGKLISLLRDHRLARKEIGGGALIVSSSRHLQAASRKFTEDLGPGEGVVSVGAVAYLLSLAPGIALELGSLRGILFDAELRTKVAALDRIVMRIVRASDEYMVPWAKRATLIPKVREQIKVLAKERNEPASEIFRQVESRDTKVSTEFAEIVAESLDQFVQSKAEREILELKRQKKS